MNSKEVHRSEGDESNIDPQELFDCFMEITKVQEHLLQNEAKGAAEGDLLNEGSKNNASGEVNENDIGIQKNTVEKQQVNSERDAEEDLQCKANEDLEKTAISTLENEETGKSEAKSTDDDFKEDAGEPQNEASREAASANNEKQDIICNVNDSESDVTVAEKQRHGSNCSDSIQLPSSEDSMTKRLSKAVDELSDLEAQLHLMISTGSCTSPTETIENDKTNGNVDENGSNLGDATSMEKVLHTNHVSLESKENNSACSPKTVDISDDTSDEVFEANDDNIKELTDASSPSLTKLTEVEPVKSDILHRSENGPRKIDGVCNEEDFKKKSDFLHQSEKDSCKDNGECNVDGGKKTITDNSSNESSVTTNVKTPLIDKLVTHSFSVNAIDSISQDDQSKEVSQEDGSLSHLVDSPSDKSSNSDAVCQIIELADVQEETADKISNQNDDKSSLQEDESSHSLEEKQQSLENSIDETLKICSEDALVTDLYQGKEISGQEDGRSFPLGESRQNAGELCVTKEHFSNGEISKHSLDGKEEEGLVRTDVDEERQSKHVEYIEETKYENEDNSVSCSNDPLKIEPAENIQTNVTVEAKSEEDAQQSESPAIEILMTDESGISERKNLDSLDAEIEKTTERPDSPALSDDGMDSDAASFDGLDDDDDDDSQFESSSVLTSRVNHLKVARNRFGSNSSTISEKEFRNSGILNDHDKDGQGKVFKKGYLIKLGGSGLTPKNWRKRWFVLKEDNCLYYYKHSRDKTPCGVIVLCNYSVTKAPDSSKRFCFKLNKGGARTYHFCATDDADMRDWMIALMKSASVVYENGSSFQILEGNVHNVSIPALSIRNPDCHGYLSKQGHAIKTWKRRYCVLKNGYLYYYTDMSNTMALGVAKLLGYQIKRGESRGKQFCFYGNPPDESMRVYHFAAETENDRERWMSRLEDSIIRGNNS